MLKRRFPYITRERLVVVALVVWAFSMVAYLRTPEEMPLWAHQFHIPSWLARHWWVTIMPAWALFTWYVHLMGWTQAPPDPPLEPKRYPFRPSVSTKQLWAEEDAELERRNAGRAHVR